MTSATIATAQLFDGDKRHGRSLIHLNQGQVVAIEPWRRATPDTAMTLPENLLLAPGLIDLQVNGGGGAFLNAAPTCATIRTMAAAHRRHGTTGLLPTLITAAPDIMATLADAATAALAIPGIIGFHLEGPFLNPARKGIHPREHVRPPTREDLAMIARFATLGRSMVTLAPEITGVDIVRTLVAAGLRVSLGHSDATSAMAEQAFAAGATGVTHLWNAMSQITPRAPGLVGATLAHDAAFAGIICDGLHVDPRNLRLAYRALGPQRLMIVTDAMPTAAATITTFSIGGTPVSLQEGRLTGPDGTLAGAHITMIESVANAMRMIGCPLEDALRMATTTPADFLGLAATHGRIASGGRADLIALTPDLQVARSWIAGMPD